MQEITIVYFDLASRDDDDCVEAKVAHAVSESDYDMVAITNVRSPDLLKHHLTAIGFDGYHMPKANGHRDGISVFWKTTPGLVFVDTSGWRLHTKHSQIATCANFLVNGTPLKLVTFQLKPGLEQRATILETLFVHLGHTNGPIVLCCDLGSEQPDTTYGVATKYYIDTHHLLKADGHMQPSGLYMMYQNCCLVRPECMTQTPLYQKLTGHYVFVPCSPFVFVHQTPSMDE